jgi:predicted nucleic acid-binding protein
MDTYNRVLQEASLVLAPDLYISELTGSLWKYYNARKLSEDQCLAYIHDGLSFIDKFRGSREIWQEAFREGINNRHSINGMIYMVTARRNNGILVTNDGALAEICKNLKVQCCY